jgi:hypothetical protein
MNIERSLNTSDARLHYASCRTINGTPARGNTWTGPYIKICATSPADLQTLGSRVQLLSATVPSCGTCDPPKILS